MTDFSNYPKQWLISRKKPQVVIAGHSEEFAGYHIQAAKSVPILRLMDGGNMQIGCLIGWAIFQTKLYRSGAEIHLTSPETVESFYKALSGQFVLVWKDDNGGLFLRENSSGGFPAVFAPNMKAAASTVTILETLGTLEENAEVNSVFNFPKNRGFLPFGLTSKSGAHRLMPNHVLDMDNFSSHRVWPDAEFCNQPPMPTEDVSGYINRIAKVVKRNTQAILEQGETVLYLSGGHDSRMILAAARGCAGNLKCETIGTEASLDVFVAAKVARVAQVAHRTVEVLPASRDDVNAWLHRTGYAMYDPVSELVATAVANAPTNHPVSGTGAELGRGSNWSKEDIASETLDLEGLLSRLRIPDTPITRRAGQVWLDSLPTDDPAMVLDIAKIEQIHGCWAGSAIYGHPLPLPSLLPFTGQRLNEMVLSLPKEYRKSGQFYRDYINVLWPELLEVPVNKAQGVARIRFWRTEVKSWIPKRIKRWLKPFR